MEIQIHKKKKEIRVITIKNRSGSKVDITFKGVMESMKPGMDFETYLISKNKSANTIDSYSRSVRKYEEWYMDKFGELFKVLHEENLQQFSIMLIQKENENGEILSPKSVNVIIQGLISFNQYLVDTKKMKKIVVSKELRQKVQVSVASPAKFSSDEVNRFNQSILKASQRDGAADLFRDYALAKVLGLTGMRISEALDIKLFDMNLESNEILIRSGKGNKSRVVYINSELHRILVKYLKDTRKKYRLNETSPFLFVSRRSNQLSRKTVNKSFAKYSHFSGLHVNLTPHDLRHHFCTISLERGFSLHEVMNLAGHSSPVTTSIYTNPSRKEMRNKMELLSD
jgi:integrase/recombinase XerD